MDKRYVNINKSISSDGLGTPVVSIYFSYCDKKDKTGNFCKMCQNKELQKDGVGFYLSFDDTTKIIDDKVKSMKKMLGREVGICFLGGEPFAEINKNMIMRLSKYYKDMFQIIYTWRMPKDIDTNNIRYFNKIVCGEYNPSLNSENYILGSTNQVIINNEKEIIKKYKGDDV